MVSGQDIPDKAGVVPVDVGSNGVDRRCECSPQSDPGLHGTAARVLNTRNADATLRQLCRRIAEPHIHVDRNIKFRFACRRDLFQVVSLMIELKQFIGIAVKDLTPRTGLPFGGSKHVSRYRAGKFLVRLWRKITRLPMIPDSFST